MHTTNHTIKNNKNILSNVKNKLIKGLAVTSLFLTLHGPIETNAQDNKPKITTEQTNTQNTKNFIDYTIKNANKYYPNTQEHLQVMLKSFRDQEQKEAVMGMIKTMTTNIQDSAQKVGATIYFLEMSVFRNGKFSTMYDNKITDPTFAEIEKADRKYKDRFKIYYANLEASLEQFKQQVQAKEQQVQAKEQQVQAKEEETQKLKQTNNTIITQIQDKDKQINEIKQNNDNKDKQIQDIFQKMNIKISKYSTEDIKNNPSIKNLILKTEQRYKDNNFSIPANIQILFNAAH